jgi:hypothetical protein
LSSSAQFEGKIAYKTSYFGCLSNSSKKNENGLKEVIGLGNSSDRNLNFGNFVGALDISPPNLHKSVSCFDPAPLPHMELPSALAAATVPTSSNIFSLIPSLVLNTHA